jgi:hypothetical protein
MPCRRQHIYLGVEKQSTSYKIASGLAKNTEIEFRCQAKIQTTYYFDSCLFL